MSSLNFEQLAWNILKAADPLADRAFLPMPCQVAADVVRRHEMDGPEPRGALSKALKVAVDIVRATKNVPVAIEAGVVEFRRVLAEETTDLT